MKVLVRYRGPFGLGDLLCSDPMFAAIAGARGAATEIRVAGACGNVLHNPWVAGPADPGFRPDEVIDVRLFTDMPHAEYAQLEARPSLVDHMCAAAGVPVADANPRLHLGRAEDRFLAELGIGNVPGPRVAICADVSDPLRSWPLARWRAVAAHLERQGCAVFNLGLAHSTGVGADLVGVLTVRQAAAVLSRCDLFLGNNSGLLHYAQAALVPCVAVFSLALPERFIHDDRLVVAVQREDLPCIDCMTKDFAGMQVTGCTATPRGRCIEEIPVADVIAAAQRVLESYVLAGPGSERGERFRSDVLLRQAKRLRRRGHVERARKFERWSAARLEAFQCISG